jgi:hypothetical protein
MVAMLLHPAAKLADVVKRQADSLLPERQLLFASIAEEAGLAASPLLRRGNK